MDYTPAPIWWWLMAVMTVTLIIALAWWTNHPPTSSNHTPETSVYIWEDGSANVYDHNGDILTSGCILPMLGCSSNLTP